MMSFFGNWFVKITGWLPQLVVFRLKVHYEDRSVQDKRIRGRAIVACNHNTLMDFAVLLFVFWRRTLRCAVAEVMYQKNFIMTGLLKFLGCIRVDRDTFDFSFMDRLKKVLDNGGVVEIFPESRLPNPGEQRPLEFKPSYVYLALETGTPIIPVFTNGKEFSAQRGQVVIGKPIDATSMYDSTLSEKENVRIINDYVRSKIIELGSKIEEKDKV